MSVMKKLEVTTGRNIMGFVDLGLGVSAGDEDEEATEAYVFMLNCMEESWKLPFGYFLIKSLNAEQRANLVNTAISKLHECGVYVVALTCDGTSSNVKMFEILGNIF